MNQCGTCKNWQLVGELGEHGLGHCSAREEPYRSAITTPAHTICRIEKYKKAPVSVLRERENGGGLL